VQTGDAKRDADLARVCLDRGNHYVDISASYALLWEVEKLDALAKRRGATAVLSVGLAPGLTNLLAKHCAQVLDELQSLDIFVMLGLGEAYG
jgi:saccharopine dehydrogenase-like NADP-dependent oxidoreductase